MNITYFHLADGDLIHNTRPGIGARDGCIYTHFTGDANKCPLRNAPYGAALGDKLGGGWVVLAQRAPDALRDPNKWAYALITNRMGNDGGCRKTIQQLADAQVVTLGLPAPKQI